MIVATSSCRAQAPIGANIGAPVTSTSWPGLSGPSPSARTATDGPDKPGHDGVATIVPPARYLIEQALNVLKPGVMGDVDVAMALTGGRAFMVRGSGSAPA